MEPTQKSHKQWRKEAKKLRRKKLRQKEAKSKPEQSLDFQPEDPSLSKEDEEDRELQEELWLRRELIAQKYFREQKTKRDAIEAIKKIEKDKIKKEFDEREKKYQAKIDEKKKLEEEAQRQWEIVQSELTDFLENKGKVPEKLLHPYESNPGKKECMFFTKTNCCRHDIKCLRNHKRPQISKILLLRNFFSHITLERCTATEHGADIGLEFTYADVLKEYHDFFEDIVLELEKFGQVVNIRTCGNTGTHMRGNVFVEFASLR